MATGGGPERATVDPTTFTLIVEVTGERGRCRARVTGRGIFDVTAPIAARIAQTTLDADFDAAGFLAASEVVEPARFLAALEAWGVRCRVGAERHPDAAR